MCFAEDLREEGQKKCTKYSILYSLLEAQSISQQSVHVTVVLSYMLSLLNTPLLKWRMIFELKSVEREREREREQERQGHKSFFLLKAIFNIALDT